MTICVISQPTYLPWIGYFDLIDQADFFVFLDTVQFQKRSWQQRNRIRTNKGTLWLTMPAVTRSRYFQKINEVRIADPRCLERHLESIRHSYAKSDLFNETYPFIRDLLRYHAGETLLCKINTEIIKSICAYLSISTPMLMASDLKTTGSRSELLAAICQEVGADIYLSTSGAICYLVDDRPYYTFKGLEIRIHGYSHPEYTQVHGEFLPYMSILDLILNTGNASLDIIRSGRTTNKPITEIISDYAHGT